MAFRNGPNVITKGLVLCLDAGDKNSYPGSGTTWFDLSGKRNHGTLTNGPTFSSANGGGIAFDGSNDHVTISVDNWIRSRSTVYTFSSFFYYSGGTSGGSPYSLMTFPNAGDTNDGFWQHLNLGGNWLWRTEDNVSGEYGGTVVSPSGFTSGNWYNEVTVVKTNSLSFYRNGGLVSTKSTTFNWANLRTDGIAYVYIGSGYGPSNLYFMNGIVFNFQMYDRELNAAEIAANYNAQKSRFNL